MRNAQIVWQQNKKTVSNIMYAKQGVFAAKKKRKLALKLEKRNRFTKTK